MRASPLSVLLLALAGCKSARYEPCTVRCGPVARPCPAEMSCGADSYCHPAGEVRDCSPADMKAADLSVPLDLAALEQRVSCTVPSDCPAGDQCRCGFCARPDAMCNRSLMRYRLVGDASPAPCVPGVTSVATQVYHGCLVKTNTTVFCWGWANSGQLGPVDLGTTCGGAPCSLVPVLVRDANGFPFDRVLKVSTGAGHTCALRDDKTVWCWGRGDLLGAGGLTGVSPPVQVQRAEGGALTSVVEISAGYTHTCARRDSGEVYCWGDNSYEQVGAPLGEGVLVPKARAVPSVLDARSVEAGGGHSCAVTGSALPTTTACWGRNHLAQLGNGGYTPATTPTPVPVTVPDAGTSIGNVLALGAGNHHTCALTQTNTPPVCWGENRNGAIGDGTMNTAVRATEVKLAPSDVMGGIFHLEGGDDHSCALLSGNVLKCWGGNQSGQLGNPAAGPSSVVPVLSATDVVQFSLGFRATCALRNSTNEVECWGANDNGGLGDGTTVSHAVPKPIAPACP